MQTSVALATKVVNRRWPPARHSRVIGLGSSLCKTCIPPVLHRCFSGYDLQSNGKPGVLGSDLKPQAPYLRFNRCFADLDRRLAGETPSINSVSNQLAKISLNKNPYSHLLTLRFTHSNSKINKT
ncbi:hypothetical protein HAX54_022412 [Datura stramonium]|uniref:Uncharacterized protein n=1 Tax=Datura stramonium TaxID=4076 RepID=A0ABS8RJU4_DATST|nr:hypothetical protein [Datura stramonium]